MPTIEYFMKGKAEPSRYNDITVINDVRPSKPPVDVEEEDETQYVDPFKVSTANGGMIMPE